MCPDCRIWKRKLWFNSCCVYWTEPWITSRPQQCGQSVRHIATYLHHISSEQNCWLDRRARRRRADHSPVSVKATVWACSHTILSLSLLSNTVFFLLLSPPAPLLPTCPDLPPDTSAGSCSQPERPAFASQFSCFSSADASLEHSKCLLHKSWVTYRQILPPPQNW